MRLWAVIWMCLASLPTLVSCGVYPEEPRYQKILTLSGPEADSTTPTKIRLELPVTVSGKWKLFLRPRPDAEMLSRPYQEEIEESLSQLSGVTVSVFLLRDGLESCCVADSSLSRWRVNDGAYFQLWNEVASFGFQQGDAVIIEFQIPAGVKMPRLGLVWGQTG